MRTSERLPEHSPTSHNPPCPFAHLVSPSVLGQIARKVRPDQRQDRQHQWDFLLLLPPYFTPQCAGAEEPWISVCLLEIAGFEFLICFLQTPTGKCPKGLRYAEHSPSFAPPPLQTSSLPTFYCWQEAGQSHSGYWLLWESRAPRAAWSCNKMSSSRKWRPPVLSEPVGPSLCLWAWPSGASSGPRQPGAP